MDMPVLSPMQEVLEGCVYLESCTDTLLDVEIRFWDERDGGCDHRV